jgi:type II secretory pathway component GspD/PulD (secretin)
MVTQKTEACPFGRLRAGSVRSRRDGTQKSNIHRGRTVRPGNKTGPGSTAGLIAVVLLLTFVFCGLSSAEQSSLSTMKYEFISLSHISGEQGKKYLADLRIGTISQIRGTNVLLITASPDELSKAVAILKLVDAEERFVVRSLFAASRVQALPSNERIAAIAAPGVPGGISIGSFSSPPSDVGATRAIIDVHNNMVVFVAPVRCVDTIVSAIEAVVGPGLIGNNRTTVENSITSTGKHRAESGFNSKIISSVAETRQGPLEVSAIGRVTNPGIQPLTRQADSRLASVDDNSANVLSVSDLFGDGQPTKGQIDEQPTTQARPEPASAAADEARASSYELPPIPNGEEVLNETLPEKLDIVYLLGLAGAYLNLDFVYDPAKVKGDVTLMLQGKLRGPIKIKDLYPLLETVLKFKGFVMTRHKGNLVTVVPKGEVLDIDPTFLEAADGMIEHGDMVVTRTFKLQHIDTDSAINLLTNMKLGVTTPQVSGTKTLIVTEFTYRMPRVEALLSMVDKPGEPRKFRFRPLQYTMANNLAPKLQTLAEQLGTVSITIAEEPVEETPQIVRRSGETAAAYQRRVQAQRAAQLRAQQAAQRRAQQAAARPTQAEPTVYLDADDRTNRILMIGLQEQLDSVQELIDALDVQQQDLRTLGLYKIKHVGADDVRKKLEELGVIGAEPETTTSRLTTPTTTAKAPATKSEAATTKFGINSEALLEEPQVVVIEATNSLLVNATAEQHVRIATIINYVDSQTELEEMPYQLYPLENQSPDHLAEVLRSLIQETVQTQDKENKIETVIKREEEIVIVPDPNTFSLIVYASKKNQEWIANLIEKLDKRRPQVLIDVTLVEVSRTDEFDLDLQLASKFPKLMPGGQMEALSSIISPFLDSSTGEAFSFPKTGTAQGFYSDAHIQALLTAIESKSYGRILAKPKILVNDGQPGEIRTTDKTNVKIESIIIPEQGIQRTATDFREIEAGIRLTITPNISEGDLLRLKVELDRTDFLPRPDAELPPDTTSSNINTIVTVPDGRTIILGGLLKLNQTKGGKKVPIIGDIPLVGGLFRSTSNTDNESRLYVFVKANILRPDQTAAGLPELEGISQRNRVAFESFEDKFQKYPDWPGLKPKRMEPSKVLEVE